MWRQCEGALARGPLALSEGIPCAARHCSATNTQLVTMYTDRTITLKILSGAHATSGEISGNRNHQARSALMDAASAELASF